jgi:hypothetical protein
MKKTLLTLSMLLTCLLGTQAQTQTLILDDSFNLTEKINAAADDCAENGTKYTIRFGKRAINQNNWNVLALPFDVKPGVLSRAFGYAAVDILVVDNPDPRTMHFAVTTSGIIPAGTPFLVRPGDDYQNFEDVVNFTKVTVKAVEPQMAQSDKNGNSIIAVFDKTSFYGAGYWYMSQGMWKSASTYTEKKPVTLKPLRAYIDLTGTKSKVAPRIVIDEPDGTTTVIDAITFSKGSFSTDSRQDDGWYTVTGLRLSEEPTAKGVYIHKARKVIIK